MPKVKSKSKLALYLSPAQYWCLRYLTAVTNRDVSEVVEEAIRYAVRHIDGESTIPRKPLVPEKPLRQNVNISRDTLIAACLAKINKDLVGWSNTDFGRYGLRHTLSSYARRYPDMGKIVRKYNGKLNPDQALEVF